MQISPTLGHTATDRITGFTGVVIGVVQYLSGCNQALLVPTVDKEGKLCDGQWFDLQRIRLLPNEQIDLDNRDAPGTDVSPNRRF